MFTSLSNVVIGGCSSVGELNESDDTQRYSACLKRDIFERDIERDMRDNERGDTRRVSNVTFLGET